MENVAEYNELIEEVLDKIESSLNYYNVDKEDLIELLKGLSKEELKEVSNSITSFNTILFGI